MAIAGRKILRCTAFRARAGGLEEGIEFEAPFHVIDRGEQGCSLAAYGRLQEVRLWTTGEATPKTAIIPIMSRWLRNA